jgi:hypothetical protein
MTWRGRAEVAALMLCAALPLDGCSEGGDGDSPLNEVAVAESNDGAQGRETGRHATTVTAQEGRPLLTTWGSSTCPPRIHSVRMTSVDTLLVVLLDSKFTQCTADMGPTERPLVLPNGADAAGVRNVVVRFPDGDEARTRRD